MHKPQRQQKRRKTSCLMSRTNGPHSFEIFFLEISVPFDFHPGISGLSVEWFAFRKFKTFRISGTFPNKCPYHLSPFRKFRNFWPNGSAHVYTDAEKFCP